MLRRVGIALMAMLFGSLVASAQSLPVDFILKVVGPVNVVRGNPIHLGVEALVTAGFDDQMVTPSVTGLPPGAKVRWLNMERFCCGSKMWRLASAQVLQISTAAATPPGIYPLQIRYRTDLGVERQSVYAIRVLAAYPSVTKATVLPPPVPLAMQAAWESNMIHYGMKHCGLSQSLWEGYAWYYDGARVYFQIADYTRNPYFNQCAQHERNIYRPYVLGNNGGIPGYRIFPDGFAMDYKRNGDTLSKLAVDMFYGATLNPQANYYYLIEPTHSRDLTYAVNTQFVGRSLGYPEDVSHRDRVELLIGHFDQWFLAKKRTPISFQPFMVGLAAEALIRYYDASGDPRIPALLKIACDEMWRSSWNSGAQAFNYYEINAAPAPSWDVSLLIAPMYAWVYRHTGDEKYRQWGDLIFNGGVSRAWLDGGKQFSQNYRWSAKYVEWRNLR